MGLGAFYDVDEGFEVVPVVLQGLGNRLAYGLEACKMDNRVDLVGGEQKLGSDRVAEIHLHEGDVFAAGDLFHSFKTGHVAIGHVVCHYHIIASFKEFHRHMAADESGSAGHENALFHIHSVVNEVQS